MDATSYGYYSNAVTASVRSSSTSDDPFAAAAAGQPALLIGDRAIDAQQTFTPAIVHDLGTEWYAWTGGDMVYAVWAVRRDVLATYRDEVAQVLEALVAARRWAGEHPERVVAAAQLVHPRPAGFYASYYATLNFTFDGAAQAGLRRFIDELQAIGLVASIAPVVPETFCVSR